MKELGYEFIYLATEESYVEEIFKNKFLGKIIVNKRIYYYDDIYNKQELGIFTRAKFDRDDDDYWRGLEYLSSIYLLSKCDALIAGNCGGSLAALFMNNMKYEYWYLFDLGLYS